MKYRTEEQFEIIARNMFKKGNSFYRTLALLILEANEVQRQKIAKSFAYDLSLYEVD